MVLMLTYLNINLKCIFISMTNYTSISKFIALKPTYLLFNMLSTFFQLIQAIKYILYNTLFFYLIKILNKQF